MSGGVEPPTLTDITLCSGVNPEPTRYAKVEGN